MGEGENGAGDDPQRGHRHGDHDDDDLRSVHGVACVRSIDEIFGTYAAAEAHAGAVKSSQAAVYTKGEVSLALAGTGRGVNVGIAFGAFTIEKR